MVCAGVLTMAVCAAQSSSRANSRKRICRENSTGSDATQGLAPSRSGSLPAALAPYVPVPSAFGNFTCLVASAASVMCRSACVTSYCILCSVSACGCGLSASFGSEFSEHLQSCVTG